MSYAQLGNYQFRINPSQVFFQYDVDSVVIPTVGGRVVQVYGVTLGDMTVQGLFGQDRSGNKESWQLAEEFQAAMAQMVNQQSRPPTTLQAAKIDATPPHQPVRFIYNDDDPDRRKLGLPIHDWDFLVYIKSLRDVNASDFTMEHSTGKFSYGYTLTLFIVEDNSRLLQSAATSAFIERLSVGIGWKRSIYNGPMSRKELEAYLAANSPDGTIHGLILKEFKTAAEGGAYPASGSATNPVAGGAATAGQAQSQLGSGATPPVQPGSGSVTGG